MWQATSKPHFQDEMQKASHFRNQTLGLKIQLQIDTHYQIIKLHQTVIL